MQKAIYTTVGIDELLPHVQALKGALEQAIARLPRVEGHGGEVQVGRDLANLLNLLGRRQGDRAIMSFG